MGLFDGLRRGSKGDLVPGEAMVTLANDPGKVDALITRATIKLVVSAEGLEPTAVEWTGNIPKHKWPQEGVVIPVMVDTANPEEVEIDWSDAPNVIKQMIGGTTKDLTQDQRVYAKEIQDKTAAHQDELQEIVAMWQRGEIDQDELMRRQTEILGVDPSQGPGL